MARRNRGLSFYRRREKIRPGVIKEIFSWLFGIAAAVFIAGVLNYFFGMSTSVVGVSMEPVLYNGQRIYISRFQYLLSRPEPGDVVVFLPNGNKNSHYYVKRVVAVPGDRVWIHDGRLYVNDEESTLIEARITEAGIAANELTLKSGEYFCLGDSPGGSEDSRSAGIGPVKEETILGKVWFCLGCEERKAGFVR